MTVIAAGAPTILIIDDDPGAVETFTLILTSSGYDVRVADDAESGWLAFQRVSAAAVLLDLHLPIANGLDFLRRLRGASGQHASVPIAVITADYSADEDMAREIHALGARLYFKPLWEDDLLALVHDLLTTEVVTPALSRTTTNR